MPLIVAPIIASESLPAFKPAFVYFRIGDVVTSIPYEILIEFISVVSKYDIVEILRINIQKLALMESQIGASKDPRDSADT